MEKEAKSDSNQNLNGEEIFPLCTGGYSVNKFPATILSPKRDKSAKKSSKKLSNAFSKLGTSNASKKSTSPPLELNQVDSSHLNMEEACNDKSLAIPKDKYPCRQSVDYNNNGFDKENDTPINKKPFVIVTSPTPDHELKFAKNVFDGSKATSLPDPPPTPPTLQSQKMENERVQSNNYRERECSISSAQTCQIESKTPVLRNADSALLVRDSKFGITTSNQRRYSSVVAELVGKRNSVAVDPMSVNPSLVLSYQADMASPDEFSYVSFPSNTSDESYDKNINFSPNPFNSEEGNVNRTYNIYRDSPTKSDSILKHDQASEVVAIRTSKLSKDSDERKYVSFLGRPNKKGGDSTFTSVSLYSSDDYLSCYSGEIEKSTSTPVDSCIPRQLSFNQVSGGFSIPENTESPAVDPIEQSRKSSPSNNSSKTKRYRSPKSPLRNRGSYTIPQTPEYTENMDRTRARRRMIGIFLIIFGLILYVFAFIGWFVILPYVESE